ncbi:hypothetical protein COF81_25015 [Bacillus pseudomycoides]|uniref:Uncharacterized protein n=1 Tax=Bacillus pseudomycoides TaxID=64104 RepID=A0ABD6SZC2_9BACI|nr:hypothetical protein COF81_25015 [Bacillus pseudomycoides]
MQAQNANRLSGEKLPAEGAGKASWKLGKPMSELTHTIFPDAKNQRFLMSNFAYRIFSLKGWWDAFI